MTTTTDSRPSIDESAPGAGARRPRRRGVMGMVRRFAVDPNSVFERQLCTAAVFFGSQLLLLGPGVDVTEVGAWVIGNALMIAATGAAAVLRTPKVPPRAAMIIPLAGIVAVGFLRAGTGGATSIFTIMMALPVISLGVEPGRLPMLLGAPVTVVALLLPLAYHSAAVEQGQWARIVFGPIILGLICLSANELTRRLRSRVRAIQRLQRDQERLLVLARDNAAMSEAASNLLRESTKQLGSVIDAVTEQSIIATDQFGRVEVFNTGAERLLKIAAHEALGRSILQFHRAEELTAGSAPDAVGSAAFEVLVAGVREGTPRRGDWTYVARDGSERRVQISVTARRDAADDVDGFLFVATDVTEDREQAKMKDEFVNLISHELRTPLSSILGYLELVADDEDHPLSDEQLRYLATIERNANRLLRLVSDLLFTAQVESGRFHLQEQRVDLHGLLQSALETATPAAAARDVRLHLSAADEPIAVWGDPVRLGQAVDNLISNAIKFTPPGGRVAVTLRGGGDDDEGDDDEGGDGTGVGGAYGAGAGGSGAGGTESRALICVSDTGMGIPAEEIDRLFSRFFRASTATKNAVPGVGLGLTITRAIAQAHGGDIRVASTLGEGTSFTLDLPRIAVPVESAGSVTGR